MKTGITKLVGVVSLLALMLTAITTCAQSSPVPLVSLPLVPGAVPPGSAAFTLTVNGTGFAASATVDWNGLPLATQFVSISQLTATVPASEVEAAGTANVTVTNSKGQPSQPAFFTVTASAATVAFLRTDYAAPAVPQQAAVADFNGDGHTDLAITSPSGFSVMLGNGDGTFQQAVNYDYGDGQEPEAIVAADVNGDGKLDLVYTLVLYPWMVAVSLGNGDGTFQPVIEFPGGSSASALVLADFNGDGKLDIAVPNLTNSQIDILLGNGDGTFGPAQGYDVGAEPFGTSMAVGDFNGDGKIDLAVAAENGNLRGISVMLGNGDGSFQAGVRYSVGQGEPNAVTAADLNGDGKPDLVAPTRSGVAVLLGNGDGTFGAPTVYGAGYHPSAIVIADLNGDNRPDVAVANSSSNAISVLLGNGDGSFQSAKQFSAGSFPDYLAVGDLNNDGLMDAVIINFANDTMSVLLQTQDAVASLSSTSLSFGTQPVNRTSPTQSVTLTNAGAINLDMSGIQVTDADYLLTNTCPASLAPQAACKIKIAFKPLKKGPLSGQVTITDNAPDSPQSIALSGTGTFALISPTSLNFGTVTVGKSSTQSVTLTNLGTNTMTINNIYTSGPPYSQTNTCGASLATKASCTISVTFSPTRTGVKSGTLYIGDSGGGSPQTVGLTGTGN